MTQVAKRVDWGKMDARKRITRVRTQLLIRQPFWGELAMRLKVRHASEAELLLTPIMTGATNGKELIYVKQTIEVMPEDDVLWTVAHEVCHCALGHVWRCDNRDPELWNIAIDAATNWILLQSKFAMPDGRVKPFPGLEGASAERIYNFLKSEQAAGRQGNYGKLSDDHSLWGKTPPTAARQLATAWKAAVAAAATSARMRGTLPAGLEQVIGQILAPKIDWKQALARFMTALMEEDLTWNRVRKVKVAGTRGAYWPRMFSEGIRLAVGLDTSGSISIEQIRAFLGEVTGILWTIGGIELTIYICDADVHAVWHLTPQDPLPDKIPGGGGTDFRPVFDRIAKDYDQPPDALVFFTDSQGAFPDEPPEYPVLWVVDAPPEMQAEIPWGEVVEYTETTA